jgi:hypothetical protein
MSALRATAGAGGKQHAGVGDTDRAGDAGDDDAVRLPRPGPVDDGAGVDVDVRGEQGCQEEMRAGEASDP